MTKYNARKTIVDGITFASAKEASRYLELKYLELGGEIENLVLQPVFVLQEAFKDGKGKRHGRISYVADFAYTENGQDVVEDVKGMETPVYRLKRKMFIFKHPHLEFKQT